MHSVEVAGSEDPENGWGPIHRSVDGTVPALGVYEAQSGTTLLSSYENFQHARRRFPTRPCLGYRPIGPDGVAGGYVWSTWAQVGERVDHFGSGIAKLELCRPTADAELRNRGILGFYARNCAEWVIAEQGAFTQAVVTVPMYDTLGPDSVAYVIKQTSMETLVITSELLPSLLACKPQCPTLQTVIVIGPFTDEKRSEVAAAGIKGFAFAEVEETGKASPRHHNPPDPSDIWTFCYTSGTTGDPKGVLVTHANCMCALNGLLPRLVLKSDDVHLSYLPLPHLFERMVEVALVNKGAAIGFYQGETLKILEDVQALRPTFFPSVPRLLSRIHDRLKAGVEEAGGVKLALFKRGYAAKKAGLASGRLTHGLWDRLIFSKVKERIGLDRVRAMITGSAPIADHVLDFLRIVFGCPILEAYGLSESCATGTATFDYDLTAGTVGGPEGSVEIRLQDIPEMGYMRTDQVHGKDKAAIPCKGRGEICMRGPGIFQGYYKMPEKTQEVLEPNGWFHTGDIGLWTPDGRLKIIDRKKNIFKLAQGEYVAPEKIENMNMQSKFVMQNFVYGDSFKTQLVCCVVVDPDTIAAWAAQNGKEGALPALCRDAALKKAVLADLQAIAAKEKLAGFEVVKALYLEAEPWQPGGELITPTFKLQRNKVRDHYQSQIDEMYSALEAAPASKL